jgi:sterol desaturase/sphingolipid hydroxylase (fatty acid hydroxylase superfamily)
MTFDTGTIITIVCVLLFYLRLIVIQRHRVQTAKYQYAQVEKKLVKNKKSANQKPVVNYARMGIQIRSWWLVGIALALIIFGAVVIAVHLFGPVISTYYWIPLNIGIIIFAFAVK